jgi:hypothetical protein
VPVVAVSVFGCVFFFIFVCVCAVVCFATSHSTSHSNVNVRTAQYTYSSATARQRDQVPSNRPVPAAYPVQSQRHSSSAPYPTSNTVPEEPVSLPKATLHHGDAPPGYEEAIRMKTVGNIVTS